MLNYHKESLARKKARRITSEYPSELTKFHLPNDGEVEFYQWKNPLISNAEITQNTVDFFRKFIKNGDLVIDIGTNIGDTTVPMALASGKEGTTLGFDPNPYVFKILQKNASLNKEKTNIVPFFMQYPP